MNPAFVAVVIGVLVVVAVAVFAKIRFKAEQIVAELPKSIDLSRGARPNRCAATIIRKGRCGSESGNCSIQNFREIAVYRFLLFFSWALGYQCDGC